MNTPASALSRREFLHSTTLGLAGGLLAVSALLTGAATRPTVSPRRLERLAKGANICRWFRFAPEDAGHLAGYVDAAEEKMIRDLGLTHVRLCLAPKMVMDPATGAIRESVAAHVDRAIERFHQAGLLVVVDLHNEDRDAELNPAWQQAFVRFWGDFAARLQRFDPDVTVLEIINEPVFRGRVAEWDAFNERLAAAIRQNAPQHTGASWGGIDGLKALKPLADSNVVYSFHCYDPFAFTHQGATWSGEEVKPLRHVPYPSSPEAVAPVLATLEKHPGAKQMVKDYGDQRWDKARLAARFREGIEWGRQHQVPLYCGEFGVFPRFAQPEHRANWFRDFGQVLAENQIGWGVWGWDEGFGLNRRTVAGKPVVDETVARALGLKLA
jgi:aryl-phospho-beta-D-glucosidase BglC (GH1 family)